MTNNCMSFDNSNNNLITHFPPKNTDSIHNLYDKWNLLPFDSVLDILSFDDRFVIQHGDLLNHHRISKLDERYNIINHIYYRKRYCYEWRCMHYFLINNDFKINYPKHPLMYILRII